MLVTGKIERGFLTAGYWHGLPATTVEFGGVELAIPSLTSPEDLHADILSVPLPALLLRGAVAAQPEAEVEELIRRCQESNRFCIVETDGARWRSFFARVDWRCVIPSGAALRDSERRGGPRPAILRRGDNPIPLNI